MTSERPVRRLEPEARGVAIWLAAWLGDPAGEPFS